MQYQLQTPYGTFTSLSQATYLDSFRLAATEDEAGVEVSNTATPGSNDAFLKWKAVSRLDWAWKGFDVVVTARYTSGFHEILDSGPSFPDGKKEHWVDATLFFDAQATYTFDLIAPIQAQPVAGYSKDSQEIIRGKDGQDKPALTTNYSMPSWKNLLSHTSITIGCNNVFGQDPPKAPGAFGFGYPGTIYDATGRFVYFSLTKKF